MARRFSRKRARPEPEPEPSAEENGQDAVRLDDTEHAWWSQRELHDVWQPREAPPAADEEPRDILADHFGEDWRDSFGFHPRLAEALIEPGTELPELPEPRDPPAPGTDPYDVLAIDTLSSWDEIVDAHRTLVRRHHPDRLEDPTDEERENAEAWIRAVNAAYSELKVRRDR